jgi:hypothetical protein
MQRWGWTNQGKIRFHCPKCRHGGIRKRKDVSIKNYRVLFDRYILGSENLRSIAKKKKLSQRTLSFRFERFWNKFPEPTKISSVNGLVLDATTIVRRSTVALIAFDPIENIVVFWSFVKRESYDSWKEFLSSFPSSPFVVSDAQKGLIKAVKEIFPLALHQRCLTHIIRRSNGWLTQNPKTKAGEELKIIVSLLSRIRNHQDKIFWISLFENWDEKHKDFLSEKKKSPYSDRKWFVHRKTRGIRSMIKNSMPYLFCFLENDKIPKTSNSVEGGINSPLKDLFRKHRGITDRKKLILAANYLKKRQRKNQH